MNKRVELNKSKLSKRRMFIVDIENAVGTGRLTTKAVKDAMARIKHDHHLKHGEHVVLGVSHSRNLFPARAWEGARLVFQYGKDGADYCLKRVMHKENVANRFQEIVLISGDGIFVEEVEMLKSAGVKVIVDSNASSMSKQLARSANVVSFAEYSKQPRMLPSAA